MLGSIHLWIGDLADFEFENSQQQPLVLNLKSQQQSQLRIPSRHEHQTCNFRKARTLFRYWALVHKFCHILRATKRDPRGGHEGPDTCFEGRIWHKSYSIFRCQISSFETSSLHDSRERACDGEDVTKVPILVSKSEIWRMCDFVSLSSSVFA